MFFHRTVEDIQERCALLVDRIQKEKDELDEIEAEKKRQEEEREK